MTRTMTAERERALRAGNIASGTAEERDIARTLLAELDAERALSTERAALAAELLAALEALRDQHAFALSVLKSISAIAWHSETEGAPALSNADRWRIVDACREVFVANMPTPATRLISDSAAIAQARGTVVGAGERGRS